MCLRELLETRAIPVDDAALVTLRRQAKREADCQLCRGYGWHARRGLPPHGDTHAAQVQVCRCEAGRRFWTLALDHTDCVLALMDLDPVGAIASVDGLYGRFGVNDRRLVLAAARSGVAR